MSAFACAKVESHPIVDKGFALSATAARSAKSGLSNFAALVASSADVQIGDGTECDRSVFKRREVCLDRQVRYAARRAVALAAHPSSVLVERGSSHRAIAAFAGIRSGKFAVQQQRNLEKLGMSERDRQQLSQRLFPAEYTVAVGIAGKA